jgi:hypothetical protein
MRSAILWGGLAAGTGDSILALILYRVPLSVIYQSIASGLLGREAYRGGLATAGLGVLLHFFIATVWAALFVGMSLKHPVLARRTLASGLAFGLVVYLFMKYVVLPLSAVVRLTPFEPLAMVGHALLVGLPIAFFARRAAPHA